MPPAALSPAALQPLALFAAHRALLLLGRTLTYSTHEFGHAPYLDAFKLHDVARLVLPSGVPPGLYAFKASVVLAAVAGAVLLNKLLPPAKKRAAAEKRAWVKDRVLAPVAMALMVASALQVTALMLFGHDTCAVPPHATVDFVLLLVACSFALAEAAKMAEGVDRGVRSLPLGVTLTALLAGLWFALYLLAFAATHAVERGLLVAAYRGVRDRVRSGSGAVLTYLLAMSPSRLVAGLVRSHVAPAFVVAVGAALLFALAYLAYTRPLPPALAGGMPPPEQDQPDKAARKARVRALMLGLVLSGTLLGSVVSFASESCG